jgi:CubicO group peptidase (beta-lactamase class C family)
MKRIAIALLALLASHSALSESPDARADALVRSTMRAHQIPGIVLGLVRDGHLVKATGYGYANVELRVPVSTASVFQSGSVAKQFTATAIMMLVTEGKIGLDDPLSKYFPEAHDSPCREVTVRQLLTHTSGVPDMFGETDETAYTKGIIDLRRDYTEDELLKTYLGLKLDFPPGDKWNYSNIGYKNTGILDSPRDRRVLRRFPAAPVFPAAGDGLDPHHQRRGHRPESAAFRAILRTG